MSWNDLRKGRVSTINGEYFITFVCQQRFPYFSNPALAQLFCQCIIRNEVKYQCQWLSWVLMPDHFHGLLSLSETTLGAVAGQLKGASARLINQSLNTSDTIWQHAYFDHALRHEEDGVAVARYIIANPLRRGLTDKIGDYPYWYSVYL